MSEAEERAALIAEIAELAPSFGRLDDTPLASLRQIRRMMGEQEKADAAFGLVDDAAG